MNDYERFSDTLDRLHALETAQCDLDDLLYHLKRGGMNALCCRVERAALPLHGRVEELNGEKAALEARAAAEARREREYREQEYRRSVIP